MRIERDIGIMYQDSGPWRSYELITSGDTFEELVNNAYICEIDQDGGELNVYDFSEAPNHEVYTRVMEVIRLEVNKNFNIRTYTTQPMTEDTAWTYQKDVLGLDPAGYGLYNFKTASIAENKYLNTWFRGKSCD